jgi:hypothetical protein
VKVKTESSDKQARASSFDEFVTLTRRLAAQVNVAEHEDEIRQAFSPSGTVSPKKVVGYARTTEVVAKDGDKNLQHQERALREFARLRAWTVGEIVLGKNEPDDAPALGRPSVEDLLNTLEAVADVSTVVVTTYDQLAGSADEFLEVEQQLQALGCDVIVLADGIR